LERFKTITKGRYTILINNAWEGATLNVGMSAALRNFYKLDKLEFTAKAMTMDSDRFNGEKWNADENYLHPELGKTKKDPEYSSPRKHLPSQIDLGPWYLDMLRGSAWPKLDEDSIGMCMQDDYIRQFLAQGEKRRPVDALQTFSHTLIHEVSLRSSRNFRSTMHIFGDR
jgi:hypothetical protein